MRKGSQNMQNKNGAK